MQRDVDTNGNGIPDWFEWAHGYHAFVTEGSRWMNPNAAYGSSGMSNLAAFQSGQTPQGLD